MEIDKDERKLKRGYEKEIQKSRCFLCKWSRFNLFKIRIAITLKVVFKIQKELAFGAQLKVIGSLDALGDWDVHLVIFHYSIIEAVYTVNAY